MQPTTGDFSYSVGQELTDTVWSTSGEMRNRPHPYRSGLRVALHSCRWPVDVPFTGQAVRTGKRSNAQSSQGTRSRWSSRRASCTSGAASRRLVTHASAVSGDGSNVTLVQSDGRRRTRLRPCHFLQIAQILTVEDGESLVSEVTTGSRRPCRRSTRRSSAC